MSGSGDIENREAGVGERRLTMTRLPGAVVIGPAMAHGGEHRVSGSAEGGRVRPSRDNAGYATHIGLCVRSSMHHCRFPARLVVTSST